MKRVLIVFLTIVLTLPGLTACQKAPAGPQIEISDVWGRPSPNVEGNTTIYLLIRNKGSEDDRLIGASSDIAETGELHGMTMENDVMKMFQVEFLEVPAGGSLELAPGGNHIMLIGLREMLEAGQRVRVVLEFWNAGKIPVEAEIREE